MFAPVSDEKLPLNGDRSSSASPISSWFIGPRGENAGFCAKELQRIFDRYSAWRETFASGDKSPITRDEIDGNSAIYNQISDNVDDLRRRFANHFPFFSPRYIGHMLSDQTLPAILGYFLGMLFNANNVTDEAAPITVTLELEVAEKICSMLGYSAESWGHLCSGGTIANLEALWVARSVQFLPLLIREYAQLIRIPLAVNLPSGTISSLTKVPLRELVSLQPRTALNLFDQLIQTGEKQGIVLIREDFAKFAKEGISEYTRARGLKESRYNVRREGIGPILRSLKLRPRIFVSAAAHYSIVKAVNILGYGEATVQEIPVTSRFRVDVKVLREKLLALSDQEYVAAVVGIIGTTEEGAVDPLRELLNLREEYEKERSRSFWIHADAAWGGYVTSLFRGASEDSPLFPMTREDSLSAKYLGQDYSVCWGDQDDQDILQSFEAIAESDSVTVDPHKLGYIPYPAGFIAFRDRRSVELVKREANYIFGSTPKSKSDTEHAVGPYILEGSKPGAAAVSCWLAHQTIPLDRNGHGKLIRESLLNARLLARYLDYHRYLFEELETQTSSSHPNYHQAFTFSTVCWPDTNVVAFFARPIVRFGKFSYEPIVQPLEWINQFNLQIYQRFSIEASRRHQNQDAQDSQIAIKEKSENPDIPIQNRHFFLSHTKFEGAHYSYESLKRLLRPLDYRGRDDGEQQYRDNGLVVLRATIMNPYYQAYRATQQRDLFFEFLKELHQVTRAVLEQKGFVAQAVSEVPSP